MKNLAIIITTFFCLGTKAQNLVPDPSFEGYVYDFCGLQTYSDFNTLVDDWKTPTHGSPDVYFSVINDTCYNYMPNTTYSGPLGIKGKQSPLNGRAFVGFYAYTIPGLNQREYIQTELSSPMIIGEEYMVTFRLSLADFIEYGTPNIGVYFSTSAIGSSNNGVLNYTPQITVNTAVMDTVNWVMVTGTFQAQDAYTHMTIGNFNDDNSTVLVNNPGFVSGPGVYGAYYYIEDISVGLANPNSIKEENAIDFKVYPTLVESSVTIESDFDGELIISSMQGSIVKNMVVRSGANQIDLGELSPGAYMVTFLSEGQRYTKRIIKTI